ncbi:hypothetical protein [Paenibacillus amylolyticus]|uniref:hypothetical protein n=1 Tax=Paenibacillus amylolyticus TaxID=1451 RepID=UPI00096C4914|nr:hypothetical protein [Paenibacillus amylolyticus]OMF47750.1 hypothetical protein BK136_02325 [Paenibacillus amylolyticus]
MKQQTFKSVDDILRYYGWEAPIKVVEVKKQNVDGELPHKVPTTCEACEGKRDTADDAEDISSQAGS